MDFWKDGLSIDEERVSVLVVSFIAIVGIALYTYVKRGDITPAMLELCKTMIYAIAGVNVASTVGGAITNYFGSGKTQSGGEG